MKFNRLLVTLSLFAAWGNASALLAQSGIVDPGSLGFDSEKFAEIDTVMKTGLEDERWVGCNAMVLKDDQICYYGDWGLQNREKGIPVNRDTIWRIYSMSKPITSVAVMQLVERGKLELDAAVSEYIPGFRDLTVLQEKEGGFEAVPPRREMTVRDLLRHSSGLTYGIFGNSEVDKRYRKAGIMQKDPDLKTMVEKLSTIPLKNHPGAVFEYSVSTDVLGYLIEVVSGQSLAEYLSENIFKPLDMKDTSFVVQEDNLDRFAELYRRARDGALKPEFKTSGSRFTNPENRFYSGGGGLCSNIDDYMQFCRMLLNEGSVNDQQVLKPETIQEMLTNQLEDVEDNSRFFKFGLGFRISPKGDYSWGGIAGTRFWVNPEKNLAMVYMVQLVSDRGDFGSKMRDLVYDALED